MNRREAFKKLLEAGTAAAAVGLGVDKFFTMAEASHDRNANIALFKETGKLYSHGLAFDAPYTLVAHNDKEGSALLQDADGELIITEIPALVELPVATTFVLKHAEEGHKKAKIVTL